MRNYFFNLADDAYFQFPLRLWHHAIQCPHYSRVLLFYSSTHTHVLQTTRLTASIIQCFISFNTCTHPVVFLRSSSSAALCSECFWSEILFLLCRIFLPGREIVASNFSLVPFHAECTLLMHIHLLIWFISSSISLHPIHSFAERSVWVCELPAIIEKPEIPLTFTKPQVKNIGRFKN